MLGGVFDSLIGGGLVLNLAGDGLMNMAARLGSKAAAGEIILSEQALNQAGIDGSRLESRSLELKGISEPVPVRVLRGSLLDSAL